MNHINATKITAAGHVGREGAMHENNAPTLIRPLAAERHKKICEDLLSSNSQMQLSFDTRELEIRVIGWQMLRQPAMR